MSTTIVLNDEQRDALLELLDHYLSTLESEIVHTERKAFRQEIKHRREVFEIIERHLREAIAA